MSIVRINNLGITDGTIVNADISSSAAIDASKLTGLSSDYVLLATTNASNNATISFDGYFSSTYKNYKILISGLKPATDNTSFRMRFRISNADVSSLNYVVGWVGIQVINTSSTSQQITGDYNSNSVGLFDNAESGANEPSILELTLFDPLATDSYKRMFGNLVSTNNDSTSWQIRNIFGTLRSATTALSGFSFFFTSGNVSTGTFKLYGIK